MGAAGVSDPVVAAAAQIDGYWYQDGITEIAMGIGMLSTSAVAYMVHRGMVSTTDDWGAIALGLSGVALGFCEGPIKKFLRARFSYPRIGYLSEVRGEPLTRRRKIMIAVFMVAILLIPIVVIVLMRDHARPVATGFRWMRWFPMVMGPGLFVAGIIDYKRFRLPRLLVTDSLVMIVGIASSVFIDAALLPWAVFGFVSAIIKIISGSAALVSLVRAVPISTE